MPISPMRELMTKNIRMHALKEQSERLGQVQKEYDDTLNNKISGSYSRKVAKTEDKLNRLKELGKEEKHLNKIMDSNREALSKLSKHQLN
jgi:hypothetical protein